MIILYTSDYRCKDIKRRREIRSVINCNIRNPYIDKIIILWQDWSLYSEEEEYQYLKHPKVEVINWEKRQTYLDFYNHSKEHYPNDIIVVSNSDIVFDYTINRVNELEFNPRKIYAITRFQTIKPVTDKSLFTTPYQPKWDQNWSFDTYIWKHPLEVIPETLDIGVGIGGCDSYLVKKLIVDNLIEVKNPMIDIRCWHRDYRFDEDLGRDYANMENYNTQKDYPNYYTRYKTGVQEYGGNKGLEFLPTGDGDKLILEKHIRYSHKLRIISFSLYGSGEKYMKGAIKNAELALDIYPEWRCWFYIHKDVKEEIVNELKSYPNVDVFLMNELILPRVWRFLPMDFDSVSIMISRDTDSLISERERSCVDEWLKSGKRFHIIRDHPHHGGHRVFAGLFGCKKLAYWNGWKNTIEKYKNRSDEFGIDQTILQAELYPLISKYNDIYVSANFCKFESDSKDIEHKYNENYDFIGEYFNEKNEGHINALKTALLEPRVPLSKRMTDIAILVLTDRDLTTEDFKNLPKDRNFQVIAKKIVSIENIPNNYIKNVLSIILPCFINMDIPILSTVDTNIPTKRLFEVLNRFDDDRIVISNIHNLYEKGILPTFNNIGKPNVWNEVLQLPKNIDIETTIKNMWNNKVTPERLFYEKIVQFQNTTGRAIILDENYLGE